MTSFISQEERRVVYVGRIHGTMTQKELKERFSLFGEIEDCTLHFRDHGYVQTQLTCMCPPIFVHDCEMSDDLPPETLIAEDVSQLHCL